MTNTCVASLRFERMSTSRSVYRPHWEEIWPLQLYSIHVHQALCTTPYVPATYSISLRPANFKFRKAKSTPYGWQRQGVQQDESADWYRAKFLYYCGFWVFWLWDWLPWDGYCGVFWAGKYFIFGARKVVCSGFMVHMVAKRENWLRMWETELQWEYYCNIARVVCIGGFNGRETTGKWNRGVGRQNDLLAFGYWNLEEPWVKSSPALTCAGQLRGNCHMDVPRRTSTSISSTIHEYPQHQQTSQSQIYNLTRPHPRKYSPNKCKRLKRLISTIAIHNPETGSCEFTEGGV